MENKTKEQEEYIEDVKKLFLSKDINKFWRYTKKLSEYSVTWDNIMRIKNQGAKKYSIDVFNSFIKAENLDNVSKEEMKGIIFFGEIMQKCINQNEHQTIIRELLRMTLRHLMEAYGIKHVKNPEDLNIGKDIMPKLSQEMFMPFTVFSSLLMCEVFNNLQNLDEKEQEKFYALTIGLWEDIEDLIMIEETLNTKNVKRKEQIDNFVDDNRPQTMDVYYDIIDTETDAEKIKKRMNDLIKKDPNFLDPYQQIIDILVEEEKYMEADTLLREGFKRAMLKITDCQGRWPKLIEWGILENRHLVRFINEFANDLWSNGREVHAIELYKKLLKSNPNDNIGARYNILAINMGYEFDEIENKFAVDQTGYVDAIKMDKWFQDNAVNFPDDFEWWLNHEERDLF